MNSRFIRSLLPGIALLVGLGCASDSERERAPCLRYLGCDPKVECEKNAKASCESDSRRDENREDFHWLCLIQFSQQSRPRWLRVSRTTKSLVRAYADAPRYLAFAASSVCCNRSTVSMNSSMNW